MGAFGRKKDWVNNGLPWTNQRSVAGLTSVSTSKINDLEKYIYLPVLQFRYLVLLHSKLTYEQMVVLDQDDVKHHQFHERRGQVFERY